MTQTHAHTVSAVILCESGLCGRFTPCNQSGLGYIQHTPRACIQHEHRHVGEYYLSTNMALYIFTSFIHIPYITPRNGTATHTASIFGCKERRGGACPVYHSSRNARHVILSHSSRMVTQGEMPVDYNIRSCIIPRTVSGQLLERGQKSSIHLFNVPTNVYTAHPIFITRSAVQAHRLHITLLCTYAYSTYTHMKSMHLYKFITKTLSPCPFLPKCWPRLSCSW